jgi:hypothetical protein
VTCSAEGHFPPPWFAQEPGLHSHTCQSCLTRVVLRIPPPPGDGFPNPKSAFEVYRLAGLDRQEQSK